MKSQNKEWESNSSALAESNTSGNVNHVSHLSDVNAAANGRTRPDRGDRAFGGYRPPFKRVSEKEKELAEREKALAEMERKMQEILKSVSSGDGFVEQEASHPADTPSSKETKNDRTSSSKTETKNSSNLSKKNNVDKSVSSPDVGLQKDNRNSEISTKKLPSKKSGSSSRNRSLSPPSPTQSLPNIRKEGSVGSGPMKKTPAQKQTASASSVSDEDRKKTPQNDSDDTVGGTNKTFSLNSSEINNNSSNNAPPAASASKNSKPPRPTSKTDIKQDDSLKKTKSQSKLQQTSGSSNNDVSKNKTKKFTSRTGGRMRSDSIEENYVTNKSSSSNRSFHHNSSESGGSSQKQVSTPEPPHVPSKETATKLFSLLSGYANTETGSDYSDSMRSPSMSLDQGAELLLSRTATRALLSTAKKEEDVPKKPDVHMKLHGVPSEDYRILYREIKEMEVEFAQHVAQGAISRRKVATHTAKMRELYANLIVLSPSYAVAKNVVHKLWMSFYKPTEALIKDSKEAFARKVAVTEDWKTRIALAIEEASVHLQDLVDRMKKKYLPALPSGIEGANVRATLSALYICLGDLSRYSLQYISEKTDAPSWSAPRQYYEQALAMKPGSGQAHNQLAVLAYKQGNYPEAVYQYTRSMCAMDPFPARENLLALYEKNRMAYQGMSHDDFNRVRLGQGEEALFDMHWLKLQGMLDTRISLEQFEAVMIHTMDSFQTMMDLGKVTSEFILKSLVMGIYCCERGGDASKESEKYSTPTFNACMVLYEVFGLVVRATSSSVARLEYLEPTSLFCSWLLAHPWLARLQDERCVFFLTGLAQLVNRVIHHSAKINPSREVDSSILMIDGFKPIASLPNLLSSSPSSSASVALSPSKSSRSSLSSLSQTSTTNVSTTTTHTIAALEPSLAALSLSSTTPLPPSPALVIPNNSTTPSGASSIVCTATSAASTVATMMTTVATTATSISTVPGPITSFDANDLTSFLSAGYTPPPVHSPSLVLPASTNAAATTSNPHNSPAKASSSSSPAIQTISSVSLVPAAQTSSSSSSTTTLSFSSPVTSNLQSLSWFLSTVRSAGQLLVFHEQTGRYSAFAAPKQAILEEEKAELLARLAERSAKIAKAQQNKSGVKKKKKSKAVRAAARAVKAKTVDPENPDSFGVVDEATTEAELKTDTLASDVAEENDEDESSSDEEKIPMLPKNYRPLLVLDAPNICMRHGNHKTFSTLGLQITIQFYRKHGYKRILAFLPDFYLDYNYVGDQVRKAKAGFDVSKTKMPDNVSLLLSLRDEGLLVATPSQDYDDTYCIEYALKHQAYIVSNDKYRDYTEVLPQEEQHQMRAWFRQHLITYTFVGDEFLTIKDPLNATQNQPTPDTKEAPSSSSTLTKSNSSNSERRASVSNAQLPASTPDNFTQVTIAVRSDPGK